jgi:hypothetical protein
VKLAIGAGSGGGISGISTGGGGGLRSLTAFGAAGLRRAFAAPPAGFARLAFALRALLAFAFPALAFWPDFRDARAFAMDAYATVGRARRQPRRRALPPSRA